MTGAKRCLKTVPRYTGARALTPGGQRALRGRSVAPNLVTLGVALARKGGCRLTPVALNLLDLKSFGERIASRDPDRQTAEVHIRIALMNRFNALGTAEIERVA